MKYAAMLLLVLAATPLYSQTPDLSDVTITSYGNWRLLSKRGTNYTAASPSVDDDKFLAYRCFPSINKCFHVIELATPCVKDAQYPVLVNANIAATNIICTCQLDSENKPTELVPNYADIHDILMKASGWIGFAVPLESGLFKVVRFDLTGAADAIRAAERAALKKDSAEYH